MPNETLYHVYHLLDGDMWTRNSSGCGEPYDNAKARERSHQSAGFIARIFSIDYPARVPYSPDPMTPSEARAAIAKATES
jgi:hypothetical protein